MSFFFITFVINLNTAVGQNTLYSPTISVVKGCEDYKNQNAFDYRIKTIEVYSNSRKLKIASYEFDKEAYLIRFDTVYSKESFPSQKKYVRYLMGRSLIIDSTINLSKDNGFNFPSNSVRITSIICTPSVKEVRYIAYDLINKYPETKSFHFNADGNCDTIYRIRGGNKDVLVYYNYQKGYGEAPAFIKSINSIYRSYMDYSINRQNKIIYCKDYTNDAIYTETNYEYNAEGLLISEVSYGESPYHRTFETSEGKKYQSNTFITNYLYKKNKLHSTVTYFCYSEIVSSGNIKFKILDPGYITEYKYSSAGLLSQIITDHETLTYKYSFFK